MADSLYNDPASWSAASYKPEPYSDSLIDLLRESAANFKGDLPRTIEQFTAVVASVALTVIHDAAAAGRDLLGECELELGIDDKPKLAVGRILGELLYASNTRLLAQCYDLAGGFGIQGVSMQAVADEHGVSRQDVSAICVHLTEIYKLPPSPAMRSEDNRKVCRKRELAKPRRARTPWSRAGIFRITTDISP